MLKFKKLICLVVCSAIIFQFTAIAYSSEVPLSKKTTEEKAISTIATMPYNELIIESALKTDDVNYEYLLTKNLEKTLGEDYQIKIESLSSQNPEEKQIVIENASYGDMIESVSITPFKKDDNGNLVNSFVYFSTSSDSVPQYYNGSNPLAGTYVMGPVESDVWSDFTITIKAYWERVFTYMPYYRMFFSMAKWNAFPGEDINVTWMRLWTSGKCDLVRASDHTYVVEEDWIHYVYSTYNSPVEGRYYYTPNFMNINSTDIMKITGHYMEQHSAFTYWEMNYYNDSGNFVQIDGHWDIIRG